MRYILAVGIAVTGSEDEETGILVGVRGRSFSLGRMDAVVLRRDIGPLSIVAWQAKFDIRVSLRLKRVDEEQKMRRKVADTYASDQASCLAFSWSFHHFPKQMLWKVLSSCYYRTMVSTNLHDDAEKLVSCEQEGNFLTGDSHFSGAFNRVPSFPQQHRQTFGSCGTWGSRRTWEAWCVRG